MILPQLWDHIGCHGGGGRIEHAFLAQGEDELHVIVFGFQLVIIPSEHVVESKTTRPFRKAIFAEKFDAVEIDL